MIFLQKRNYKNRKIDDMIFKQKKIEIDEKNVEKLSEKFNIFPLVANILVARGYDTEEKIYNFLNPNLKQLHNPFLLKNMDILCEKIKIALSKKQRVLIFGDYDVDGISATAILYKFFESKGLKVDYFLPNRYEDGYGLTMETSQKIIEQYNPELVITVDCGISCKKEIDFLLSKGIDVVVTDHHEIPNELPSCPVIDAKMQGQDYPFTELCGAGIAFKIVQAMGEDLDSYLPICSIATIADIVSLTDENRVIVAEGLKRLNLLPIGIKMLFSELNLTKISAGDIAFKVAPKINASGRMGDATISLLLYISEDLEVISNNLQKLNAMNTRRQELCNQIYVEAVEKLKQGKQNDKRTIILYDKNWDSGLLGIVCARLTEEFNKPTFLFSEVDGLLKGSVRSIASINIHDALSNVSTLLETFGGHSMAAGLTIKLEQFNKFEYEIENYFLKNYNAKDFVCIKEYDLQLDSKKINLNLCNQLEILEPCGCGNPKPLFYSKFNNLKAKSMKNYAQHLNITTNENFPLIAFNSGSMQSLIENSYVCELTYELQINEYKKKKFVKGLVKNIKCSGYKDTLNDFVVGNYLEQLVYNKSNFKNTFATYDNLTYLLNKLCNKSNYGTLLVANSLKQAKELSMFLFTHSFDFYLGEINLNSSNNAIIVGLNSYKNLTNYSNIVFLEPLLNMDYLNNFQGNLYLPKNHNINLNSLNLDLSHEYFSLIYKSIISHPNLICKTKYDYYENLKKISPELKNFSYVQFVVCLNTFTELGFFIVQNEENYRLKTVKQTEKKELTLSNFYVRIKKIFE